MFWNWFKQKANQVKDFFSTTYNVGKCDRSPIESPEIMRVVHKFASIFMDAEVTIQDNYNKIHKHKTDLFNKLLGTDPLYKGKAAFLNKLCKITILEGGSILKKTNINGQIRALDLLQPCHITATNNNNKSRLQIDNFREFFSKIQYQDNYTGTVSTFEPEEINFIVDNSKPSGHLHLCSRLTEIQAKINNSYYANTMLSSMLNRCSIVFLTKDNKSEFGTLNTSGEVKERTKNFNDAYTIANSAVVPIGDNMRVLNTSINVRATGVFDSFVDTISAACSCLGITRTIIDIEGSTFSNQEGAMKDAIQNGVQSFANTVADAFTDMLKEQNMIDSNQRVVFDYTHVLARNLAGSGEEIQQIEANEQVQINNETQNANQPISSNQNEQPNNN